MGIKTCLTLMSFLQFFIWERGLFRLENTAITIADIFTAKTCWLPVNVQQYG